MYKVCGTYHQLASLIVAGILSTGILVSCAPSGSSLQSIHDVPTTAVQSGSAQTPNVAANGSNPSAAPAFAVGQSSLAGAPTLASSSNLASPASTDLPHGIIVSGTGTISAPPDEAFVTAGVQTRATTAQEAQGQNNQTMQAVISALKGMGIPDKDIQTSGISLYPVIGQNQNVTGYNASNNVTVIVENVDQTGAVLDAAVKAGANTASNVRFGFKDDTAVRNKALAAAAADARTKADALARALGLKVTGIESVSEASTSSPVPLPVASTAVGAAAAVPVEPGELSVSARVTIVFAF